VVSVNPTDLSRRSFVYRKLAAAGARFGEVAGGAVALGFGDVAGEEIAAARRLALADLSVLPRLGFKGREALAWLDGQGLEIGSELNRAYIQDDGARVAVLAATEAVVLCDLSGDAGPIERLEAAWSMGEAGLCFPVLRRDGNYWFALTGDQAATAMAKLCGVDLRTDAFSNLAIAQTSVARSNAIVLRDDIGPTPVFHLLGDCAAAESQWDYLLDAMAEFEGRLVGWDALRALERTG